jgi:uncharacterized membrane protein
MNLKNELTPNQKMNFLLILMTGFCFLLSILRVLFSGTSFFLFLNWNLFLAAIPYFLTASIPSRKVGRIQQLKILGVSMVWLLFFPNAPYILTDLFHLRLETSVPKWFDLVLIISFAWTGLLFGFLSLMKIERLYTNFFTGKQIAWFSSIILFLASFGVYLGRFLRWNSWDVINNPGHLLFDISDRVINPFEHPRTWGVTILFGVLLNIIYWTIKLLRNHKSTEAVAREEYFII